MLCAREGKLLIPTYLLTYLPHIDAKATMPQVEGRFWYLAQVCICDNTIVQPFITHWKKIAKKVK